MNITITLPDGSQKTGPAPEGFIDLTPEEQQDEIAQIERQLRINSQIDRRSAERQEFEDAQDAYQAQSGIGPAISRTAETIRGYIPGSGAGGRVIDKGITFGLTDHIGAASTYLDGDFGDMPYNERLAVTRGEYDDMLDEAEMGPLKELALQVFGTMMNPITTLGAGVQGLRGYGLAAGTGAGIGATEGALGSDWENPGQVATDAAQGATVGAVADVGGQAVTDLAGMFLRGLLGSEGAQQAYGAFGKLGLPQTADVIGDRGMGILGNAMAETPIISNLSKMMDWVAPGASSARRHDQQVEGFNQAGQELINPQGVDIADPSTTYGPFAERTAQGAVQRNKDEVAALEADMDAVVPPDTNVPLPRTQAVPDQLREGGSSESVAVGPAQAEVDRIGQNVRPRDVPSAQNRQQLDAAEAELAQVTRQIEAITSSGAHRQSAEANQQLNALTQTKKDLEMGVAMLKKDAVNMEGAPLKAVREDRSVLGESLADDGLGVQEAEKKMLYGAMTDDIKATVEREAGPEAVQQFEDMMTREQELFANRKLLRGMSEPGNAAANVGRVKAMLTKGNEKELAALTDGMSAEDLIEFRAKSLYMLGDKNGDWNGQEFAKAWRKAGPDNQAFLVPDEGQRNLMEAFATVAERLQTRGKLSNHSNTAMYEQLFRSAQIDNMGETGMMEKGAKALLAGITTVTGIDRVIASEALAKAMAGQPSEFSKMLEQAILAGQIVNNEGLEDN